MEEHHRMDLTYITERIITIFCPAGCPEQIYLQNLQEIVAMLQSKHGHNYMLINLSQRHVTVARMNHKVLDTGWVDLLAPSLDQIFNVCTTMENWLQTHPKHVLVLHCRGGKGRLGVLVASYIHFSYMSASADLSLDHFAMRRFCNDKLTALMTPSQKRYAWMLGSVLKGGLRMCPSPSFLLCVVLHGLPKVRADGGCCLFLRVYQSLQAVCTSAVYHVDAAHTDRLYFVLQPAQLLKGDIMVVCYDKNNRAASRQVVFRLQFHTGLVLGHSLAFSKADLDCASEDPRFPEDGKVELLLSDSPEKIAGRELWLNGRCVTVDYDTLDPLVRRDSYQLETAPLHVLDPGNGGLYTRVRKTSGEEGASFLLPAGSPSCSDRAPSASSDSGLSVASLRLSGARPNRGAAQDKLAQGGRLVSGGDIELIQPLLEVMTELASCGGGEGEIAGDESGLGRTLNGEASSSERETDILDDEDDAAVPASDVCSLASENLPETQRAARAEYSTQSWVRQQQMVDVVPANFLDGERRSGRARKERPPPLVAPDTPPRGLSSRDAVRRGPADGDDVTDNTPDAQTAERTSPCQDDELASLSTDIDESIEQLNQLILDLDPTFVPVPNSCAPLSRSASLHTNGLSHKGSAHLSDWKQQKQVSDVTDYASLHSPGWRASGPQSFRDTPLYSPSFSSSQHGHLFKTNSVDYRGQTDTSDIVPPTPTFPVSPPTPYAKHFSEFSQLRTGGEWDQHSWTRDSRSFLDGMNHAGGSADGELFRSDVSVTPASCQRIFGSMCSVSSGSSPLPHTDSSTPPAWHDRTPTSLNSPFPLQPSSPCSLSTPNAHSSPGGLRGARAGTRESAGGRTARTCPRCCCWGTAAWSTACWRPWGASAV